MDKILKRISVLTCFGILSFAGACGPRSGTSSDLPPVNVVKYTLNQTDQNAIISGVKSSLKDPESARFGAAVASKDLNMERTFYVCGKVNAKNSYGGYVGEKYYYGMLIKDGEKSGFVVLGMGASDSEQSAILTMCSRRVTSAY